MSRTSLRWALLFLFLILLPVSVLTYRSVQTLQDERESVLEELQWMADPLQDVFDRTVDHFAESLTYAEPEALDLRAYESNPEVAQAFAFDADGDLLYPLVLPLRLSERRPSFSQVLLRGEMLEFQEQDCAAAVEAYWEAWKEAQLDAENAEVLNALARCVLKAGDVETARSVHRKLTFYNRTFDADGAHPATLSHLRLAGHLGGEEGIAVLSEWTRSILSGGYPLYPGCRQALRSAGELVARWQREETDVRALPADLERIERQIDFAEEFPRLLENHPEREMGYISGVKASGDSYLIYLRPLPHGETAGLLFDLEQLCAAVVRSQAGARFGERGFEFDLFDVDRASAFAAEHQETIHIVTPASRQLERMRLGAFAADAAGAMQYYRRRNLVILSGIFVLVGFVALGGYAIFRDTSREMRTARLRSEFVSNVSHELRTPLTAIRMNAETLLAGRYRSPEKHDEFLRTVIRESERLSRLVDNILTFSQIESGRKTYDFEECDLGEIVVAALEPFEPLLHKRGFQLEVEVADPLPPMRADREAVATAVSNLFSNAVKYSPERREIRVAVSERSEDVVVEVADRGIGVPPDERQRIFEKFHRAANAATGAATGAGVGLALTRSIVDAHGGQVEVEARGGGGSIFRLVFPELRS